MSTSTTSGRTQRTTPASVAPSGPVPATRRRRSIGAALRDQRGAETAEYAIATMAAVAFAGLLVAIMQSDTVRAMLEGLVEQALTFVA